MSNALPYLLEKQVAISAVVRACKLTASLFASIRKDSQNTLTKSDTSPVTIADFAAQAVVNSILHNVFPDDPIVGEEDSKDLRVGEQGKAMAERITELANDVLSQAPGHFASVQERAEWGVGTAVRRNIEEILEAVDQGTGQGGSSGRFWCLDPIDGTKGFLRGGQYAVCLALVVNSVVQVGVIGCPNLPFDDVAAPATPGDGSIFVAVRGQGSEKFAFPPSAEHPSANLSIPQTNDPSFRLLESVEAAHSDQSFGSLVASALRITTPPLRMDSQAKYAAVASQSSGGDVYLRLPVPGKNYVEKIWDHAAGSIIIEEAGGIVSDSLGRPLNFGLGRTLGQNFGIVACATGEAHSKVVSAIADARRCEEEQNFNAFEAKVGAH